MHHVKNRVAKRRAIRDSAPPRAATKSGTLEIRTGRWIEKLAFEEGVLTYSSSSNRSRTLGKLLIENGAVTQAAHKKARKMREKNIGVAKALTELEVLSEEELLRFLRKKAESELFELVDCDEGQFSF